MQERDLGAAGNAPHKAGVGLVAAIVLLLASGAYLQAGRSGWLARRAVSAASARLPSSPAFLVYVTPDCAPCESAVQRLQALVGDRWRQEPPATRMRTVVIGSRQWWPRVVPTVVALDDGEVRVVEGYSVPALNALVRR